MKRPSPETSGLTFCAEFIVSCFFSPQLDLATIMNFKRAKRAIEQTPSVTADESAVAHFAGCSLVFIDPGVPLRSTPGFTPSPRSAG